MTASSDPTAGRAARRATRAALEARRAQALADLAEVDLQVSEGELDDDTALRLRARYGAELADAITALDAPDVAEVDPAPSSRTPSSGSVRATSSDEQDEPADEADDVEDESGDAAVDLDAEPDDERATADGESDAPRSRRRTVLTVAVAVVALVVVGVLAQMALKPKAATGSAGTAANASTDTTRDLSTVSNQEMEDVIASNPDIVPMRLALVERYLQAGDATKAHDHAKQAFDRATTTADKARAERYLGWSTSLLGDPATGATMLADSLVLEPSNPDALWFLAIVRYRGLNTPAEAVPLLQQLLDQQIPDAQRTIVNDKLAEIKGVVAGGQPPASTGSTTATAP